MAARPKRPVGKKKQQEPSKVPDSTTSGNEVHHEERLRGERRMMIEGQKYVRHPEDDATFLVSSIQVTLLYVCVGGGGEEGGYRKCGPHLAKGKKGIWGSLVASLTVYIRQSYF
jgi:hypothetical protein